MSTNRGAFAALLVLLLALTSTTKANAQNFTPIARATTAEETLLGQPIPFSSAESIHPDEGPQPLSSLWDFGDGATSINANPSHAYTNGGAYRVSLTVSDGADSAIDTVVVHGLNPTSSADAAADLDGDGAGNRDEFLAGTNPRDAFSRLTIHEVKRYDTGGLSLLFSSVSGKSYLAEYADSLPATNWQALGIVAGDGAEQITTDTNAPVRQRFYQMRLPR